MSSNSSSIVISFSIAILLLLTLLLLISYNSKCKMDNIERFENEVMIPNQTQISEILRTNNDPQSNSVASNSYVNLDKASNSVQGSINPNDDSPAYATTTGSYLAARENEGFVGNTKNDIDDGNSCFIRDRLTSSDLLPLDSGNSKWAQINPSGSGMLGDQNFLTAGYHVGINTIGQSLRNANLQLRSEPPNPQVAVSPWGISTIEPDVRAVAFEIGSAPSF
jgi:hypothetical protein